MNARLISLVGAATAGILLLFVPSWEDTVNVGYLDIGGIPTKCSGDTDDVVVGQAYSDEECRASLEAGLIRHAKPVLDCVPQLRGHPYQLAAAVSLAYNIGATAFCNSTAAKRFRSGDWRGACKAFEMWNRVDGTVINGLVRRRAAERKLCERGL